MDGDGQHPPEVIGKLIASWDEGSDVVHTLRTDSGRRNQVEEDHQSAFYRMLRALSGLDMEPGMDIFRFLSAQARYALLAASGSPAAPPRSSSLDRIRATHGALRGERALERLGLVHAKAHVEVSAAMASSASPCDRSGSCPAQASPPLLSRSSSVPTRSRWESFSNRIVPGWASTLAYLTMLQGLMFLLLGGISVYVGAVYAEVLDRPTYLIRRAANPVRHDDGEELRSSHDDRE